MVFESLVVDLMNRFLGDYVENLDRSQLKLGIWGGKWVFFFFFFFSCLKQKRKILFIIFCGGGGDELFIYLLGKRIFNSVRIVD